VLFTEGENAVLKLSGTFAMAVSLLLLSVAVPQPASAQEFCGVITYKQGYSVTPWAVQAEGVACSKARKVAKKVAKAYAKGGTSVRRVAGWKCANESVQTSLIVCSKSGQRIQMGWGH
jgi:hypothetical protein